MFNPVEVGKRTRYSYAKIDEVLDMPNLIEIQKKSYQWFLQTGLTEIFRDISPIQDFTGNLVLSFDDFRLGESKYDVEECKERDVTYAAPLNVKVRLVNRETGEIKEQNVFMGDFPLMTDNGTFIINGAERVIVSQLVRSPGVYYDVAMDANGKELFFATIIPNRGEEWFSTRDRKTMTEVIARLNTIVPKGAANLERAYPKENEKTSATVIALRDQVGERSRAADRRPRASR